MLKCLRPRRRRQTTDKTWPEKLTWSYGSSELNKTCVLASYIKNVLQKWNITLNHFLKIFISSAKNMLFDISNAICVLYSFGSFKTKYYLWNIHLDKWYFTCKSIQVIISLLSATNNDEKLHNGWVYFNYIARSPWATFSPKQ